MTKGGGSSNAGGGGGGGAPWSPTSSSQAGKQPQKMVKVLELPLEMNAFVFHCNAQTRDECLERGLLGWVLCGGLMYWIHHFLFCFTTSH